MGSVVAIRTTEEASAIEERAALVREAMHRAERERHTTASVEIRTLDQAIEWGQGWEKYAHRCDYLIEDLKFKIQLLEIYLRAEETIHACAKDELKVAEKENERLLRMIK